MRFVLPSPIGGGSGSGTGTQGPRGYSAYQIAQQEGFVGTADEWIASLKGADGKSAYQTAVDQGFVGTASEWILSLKGADGIDGTDGKSVELQKTETAIQWRQTDGSWADLVLLSDLVVDGGGGSYDDTAITQRIADVETDLAENYPRYDFEDSLSCHYILAGRMSDDGNGNYIQNGGGIIIGGINGVRYRQEGFYEHADEGSIASYPQVANRANRLALCPSGDPENIVGEDTASFALQHLNGAYEQRFVLVSKKAGEYRIASVATGIGVNFPITVAPGPYRTQRWEINGSTTFTAEPLAGSPAINTVVAVKNPSVAQYLRLFGRTSGEFGMEYVSGAGNLDYRFNQIGLAIGGANATRRVHVQTSEQAVGSFFSSNTHATYTGLATHIDVARVAHQDYSFFFARSNSLGIPDIEFNLRGDGQAFADLTWNANGADYAELFEWLDGNPQAEDRVGLTVVLVGDKIRPADAGEEPVGVVSATPSVLGNAAWNSWKGKYLRDDFGRIERDADGNPLLNPDFDEEIDYTPRDERPEWSPVGLTGRLRLFKGQPTGSRWIKLSDVSGSVEEWLVR